MAVAGAALLEIGNELLSGKVRDTNGPFLIAELRELGYPLHEVRVIGDERAAIARAVRELAATYETVFTSGGVGPTHDDVTLAGIADAFGEPLVRNDELARLIRRFYKDGANEHVLRMADVPQSTVLLESDRLLIPFVTVRNVWVLPGEPTIFRKKWAAVRDRFRRAPYHQRRIFTTLDEGELAGWLAACEGAHAVAIGSYPRYDAVDYRVMIVIEAKDPGPVEAAAAELLRRIPEAALVRTE